jgi:hypothetical protein
MGLRIKRGEHLMTVTKVLVIYSIAQKVRRTLVKLDHAGADDREFAIHEAGMVSGEDKLYIAIDVYKGFDTKLVNGALPLDIYIASIIGPPASDRCAVITGKGRVVAVIAADPRIDDHPDGFLIQDDAAYTGAKYDFERETAS